MNDESLAKLICKLSDLRRQSPGTAEHYACVAMLDARIAQAEAAEKAMESWLAWCDSGNVEGTWDAFVKAVADYKAAKEAVRRLEEGQS
jgi:hypothetical protein